jgi:hypothetical protein
VTNELILKWDSMEYEWEIINMLGNQVLKGKSSTGTESLDVSFFKPGVYIIKVRNKQNKITALDFLKK